MTVLQKGCLVCFDMTSGMAAWEQYCNILIIFEFNNIIPLEQIKFESVGSTKILLAADNCF
jgi:hypothetical protein